MTSEAERLAARARGVRDTARQPVRAPAPEPVRPPPRRRSLPRIGLVLAGGGAKGAYQAGVVDYLAARGFEVCAVGGASIGALNGAVLTAAPDLTAGAAALIRLWRNVAAAAPAGERPVRPEDEGTTRGIPTLDQVSTLLRHVHSPVLDPAFIESLVAGHVDAGRLRAGVPLWVTASASADMDLVLRRGGWIFDVVRAALGAQAEWLHLNELPPDQVHAALVASASLPLIFAPRKVGDIRYRDGGLMDNVPLAPLAASRTCDLALVVHLGPATVWHANRFPGIEVLEIRPLTPLAAPGGVGWLNGLLDFSAARVEALIAQGRTDAEATITPVLEAASAIDRWRDSSDRVAEQLRRGLTE